MTFNIVNIRKIWEKKGKIRRTRLMTKKRSSEIFTLKMEIFLKLGRKKIFCPPQIRRQVSAHAHFFPPLLLSSCILSLLPSFCPSFFLSTFLLMSPSFLASLLSISIRAMAAISCRLRGVLLTHSLTHSLTHPLTHSVSASLLEVDLQYCMKRIQHLFR